MKRIVALLVATAGAAVVGQRWQARQAERALWVEITDPSPRESATPQTTPQQDLVGSH
ncbi:DLW-39 family protein [Mobilicoccus caccae]|uniref:Uncharacterized protein n=1 Tax=Mobilicoccus caccae TaxID=1859295 RepID=A0ABQ6IV34_9MICO|nr:DLW-39 family protein [Mobilicoccus caccae]GMA41799.1 hypothetical protein GCM10025883_38440 [Mobilicoccus caccae]